MDEDQIEKRKDDDVSARFAMTSHVISQYDAILKYFENNGREEFLLRVVRASLLCVCSGR